MIRAATALSLAALWLLAGARPVQAHIVGVRLGDFYAGVLHPLTGVEDAVLWLGVGALAGTQGAARARLLVGLFPAGLLLGLVAGFRFGSAVPASVDAALMVVIGGLLAAGPRLAGPLLATIVGAVALVLAVVRGAANASGAGPGADRVLFAAGLVLTGYAVITLTMAATIAFRSAGIGWRLIAVRAAGSWLAAIGMMLGGYALSHR